MLTVLKDVNLVTVKLSVIIVLMDLICMLAHVGLHVLMDLLLSINNAMHVLANVLPAPVKPNVINVVMDLYSLLENVVLIA